MKAKELLLWIAAYEVSGSALHVVEVPDKVEQTESWWWDNVGALPPAPIPKGTYLYFDDSETCDIEPDVYGIFSRNSVRGLVTTLLVYLRTMGVYILS